VVAQAVLKAATSRHPQVRYPAGPLARRLSLLKKFAPATVMDWGIRRQNKLTATPQVGRRERALDNKIAGAHYLTQPRS